MDKVPSGSGIQNCLLLEFRHPYPSTGWKLDMWNVEVTGLNMQETSWLLRRPDLCLSLPWAVHLATLCLSFPSYLSRNLPLQLLNNFKWDCLPLFKTAVLFQHSLNNKCKQLWSLDSQNKFRRILVNFWFFNCVAKGWSLDLYNQTFSLVAFCYSAFRRTLWKRKQFKNHTTGLAGPV